MRCKSIDFRIDKIEYGCMYVCVLLHKRRHGILKVKAIVQKINAHASEDKLTGRVAYEE